MSPDSYGLDLLEDHSKNIIVDNKFIKWYPEGHHPVIIPRPQLPDIANSIK